MALYKKLTVCIPTYNRKERLFAQLEALSKQKQFNNISVLICDNQSNYDVKKAVNENFPYDNVNVITRSYNIGAGANIASLFLDCNTSWMWTLGDDDLITNDALEIILEDIEKYPDVVLLKYSILGNFIPHIDKEMTSVEEIIDYFSSDDRSSGDLIFLSNNVYNLDIAMKYYGETLLHCYSRISQLLPAFYCLSKKEGKVQFRSKKIVEFLPAPSGTGWGLIKVALGISIIPHLQLGLSLKDSQRLSYIVSRDFKLYNIILKCLESNRKQNKYFYEIIYNSTYRHSPKISDHILNMLFYIQYYSHINIVGLLKELGIRMRDKGILIKK